MGGVQFHICKQNLQSIVHTRIGREREREKEREGFIASNIMHAQYYCDYTAKHA